MNVDPKLQNIGAKMLDYIQIIFCELMHYLRIKQECWKDYLYLWRCKDNQDKYFNDYLLIRKIEDHIDKLVFEPPKLNIE